MDELTTRKMRRAIVFRSVESELIFVEIDDDGGFVLKHGVISERGEWRMGSDDKTSSRSILLCKLCGG